MKMLEYGHEKIDPLFFFILYVPIMNPDGVFNGVPDVYSKELPGFSIGFSPTTPAPRTSCTLPIESDIVHDLLTNFTVSSRYFQFLCDTPI